MDAIRALLDEWRRCRQPRVADALLRAFDGPLRREARRLVKGRWGDRHDEVLEVCLVAAWRNLDRLAAARNPSGLLVRLARWRALALLARDPGRRPPAGEVRREPPCCSCCDPAAAARWHELLDRLDARDRDIARLVDEEDMSLDQAARCLSVRRSLVRSRLRRLHVSLRRFLR